jgi:hypothetical protein
MCSYKFYKYVQNSTRNSFRVQRVSYLNCTEMVLLFVCALGKVFSLHIYSDKQEEKKMFVHRRMVKRWLTFGMQDRHRISALKISWHDLKGLRAAAPTFPNGRLNSFLQQISFSVCCMRVH